jgi:hypothetical protein
MASNSGTTTPPPSNTQSSTSEQFREYLSGIDFYNDQGADDMFANPTPVPGFEIYPQRDATPVPDFKGDGDHENDENLGHDQNSDVDDSEDDADFENEDPVDPAWSQRIDAYIYDDDPFDLPAAFRAPRSTPLAPLRFEDFPPARGTGLGKTTVLIRKRPRVADETHIGIGSAANAGPRPSETLRPNPPGMETLSAAIEKRVNASTPSIEAAGVPVKVTSDMGPPPPRPWHRSVGSISAGGQTTNGSHSNSGPAPERQRLPQSLPQCKHLPLSGIRDSALTGTGTGSETRGNGQSSSRHAPLGPSPHDVKNAGAALAERLDASDNLQAVLASARTRYLGGRPAINDSPSDAGPSPKRQRLSQSLHQKKPLPGREHGSKPAEVNWQRCGETAPRNFVPTGRPTINTAPPETGFLSKSYPEWAPLLHRGHGFVLADQRREEARNRAQLEFQRKEAEDERRFTLTRQRLEGTEDDGMSTSLQPRPRR